MLTQRELDDFLGGFSERKTTIKKVKFPELRPQPDLPQTRLPVEFVGDVTVEIWAELGEASLTVGEILNIKEESVIELEKAAGDNVDLKINGQAFARGEVIVIGNNLGIRVDRIIEPNNTGTAGKDKDSNG